MAWSCQGTSPLGLCGRKRDGLLRQVLPEVRLSAVHGLPTSTCTCACVPVLLLPRILQCQFTSPAGSPVPMSHQTRPLEPATKLGQVESQTHLGAAGCRGEQGSRPRQGCSGEGAGLSRADVFSLATHPLWPLVPSHPTPSLGRALGPCCSASPVLCATAVRWERSGFLSS